LGFTRSSLSSGGLSAAREADSGTEAIRAILAPGYSMRQSRRLRASFIGTVRKAGLLLWAVLVAGALAGDRPGVTGALLGGGISLGSFEFYRLLGAALLQPERRRRARIWLYLIWTVKWPGLWVLLYWALGDGRVAVEWLCLGLGVVPAAVMLLALAAAVGEARWRGMTTEGEQ
jgi:hypothetical protein